MRTRLLCALVLVASLGAAPEADLDFTCPPGATLREIARDAACETPDGVGEGPFWQRFDDGSLRIWGTARGGETDGRWIQWHRGGARAIEAQYRAGVLDGAFTMWNEDGVKVYAGTHDARGEMHGVWTRWWPSGAERARWEMRHGVAHGRVEAWWESGERRLAGRRESGLREGHWIWWDETGRETARCRYARDAVVAGRCGESSP
jgi:antitoxin component YwqK of YwqJK toxin-antitoxin module